MTQVIFKFNNPDGTPRADAAFEVRLTVPGLVDSENSVVLPQTYKMVTDANGEFTMELEPAVSLYKVRAVPENEDDCCGHTFSFYVPESAVPVYVQDLIMLPPPSNVPWDEEQMNKILQAVIDSNNSAIAAHASEVAAAASADRAELAAQGVEDYADAAAASAAAALVSQNAAADSATAADASKVGAAGSATSAANSATAADASKTDAATSATNSANSATAAAGSASAADASKVAAAGSETAAAGSATTASTKAGEAAASASAAAGSATTASTKAGEASASAVTAKNEADRAQGYADSINPDTLAPINSPTFTGDPKAPTPASTDSDTSVATTAFVRAAMALFGIGIVTNAPALDDFNDTTAGAGLYATSGTTLNPPPQVSNGTGILLHKVYGTAGFQLFNQFGSSTFVYRSRIASAWQPWQHVGQDVLGLYGLGLSTYQPNWPNTSLDDCTAVRSGVYRAIASTAGMPSGINTASVVKFWLRDGATAGTFQVVQELINASTGRRFTRTAPGTGTAGAPTWGSWREEAYLDNTTFTGTTTVATLNAGNVAASSLYSSSTIRADGDISSKTGFTATPAADGTTAGTFFTKADFANSGYLQFAATPTGMNIVSGRTGTGVAQNLDFYTTLGVLLRLTQSGAVNLVSANRLQGNWSNTVSARTLLQTNVVNGNTAISAIPNGTAQISGIHFYGSTDVDNTSLLSMYTNAASAASSIINTTKTGTGTVKDLILMYQDAARITLNAQGTQIADSTNIQGNWYAGPGAFASRTFFRSPAGQAQTQLSIGPAVNAGSAQTVGIQAFSHPDLENSIRLATYTDGNICAIAADRTGTASFVPLTFYSGGAERFRITGGGEVLFGAIGSGGMYNASVNNPGIALNTVNKTLIVQAEANTTNMHLSKYGVGNGTMAGFWVSGTGVGSISCSASNVSYNTTSDYRLKRDVRDMPDSRAYIKALRPVLHYWNNPDAEAGLPTAGFIAHELQEIYPQAVTGVKDAVYEDGSINPQQVDYSKLVVLLTASLKSVILENEEQAEQIATLTEENRVLKLQVAAVLEHLSLTVDTTAHETTEGV